MSLRLFWSSVGGNQEMKKQQQRIIMVLEGKKIPFEAVDISQNSDDKDEMRKIAGDSHALPPQLSRGDTYLGDFTAFDAAIEEDRLEEFLKV